MYIYVSAGPCLSGAHGCGDREQELQSAVKQLKSAIVCSAVAGSSAVADSRSAIWNRCYWAPETALSPSSPAVLRIWVVPEGTLKSIVIRSCS